jgi:hypothetical protein
MKKEDVKDFTELNGDLKRKMKKYYRQQLKKHPDVAIVDINQKVMKKFNVQFIQ